jgi:methylmalonyl-CoA mutase N-terminal domain/subunit
MRFKFHAQTSGADLTRQQPLNNIARVALQALAGIFGSAQSMHTDGYDEAITCPTIESAKVAIATQNILRDEAHLCDVIDPLGGSYYLEALTDQMEVEIEELIARTDDAGGMYRAVETGLVQGMIGESALAFQEEVETGQRKVVGVNCFNDDLEESEPAPYRPQPHAMEQLVADFVDYKKRRKLHATQQALDMLARSAVSKNKNIFAAVVDAAQAGATHGEIVACLRQELGFGHPLITP